MQATIRFFLILSLACQGLAFAQTPAEQEEAVAQETTVESAGPEAVEEADDEAAEEEEVALPDIDVWSEEDQDDDVFIPTESISADASIAFPVDI
ncbi:MAG: hypothetical protein ACR2QU_04210 [Gammaproteobacteria bacterium]